MATIKLIRIWVKHQKWEMENCPQLLPTVSCLPQVPPEYKSRQVDTAVEGQHELNLPVLPSQVRVGKGFHSNTGECLLSLFSTDGTKPRAIDSNALDAGTWCHIQTHHSHL